MRQQVFDFRDYQPAVVILIDFVKHSIRSVSEIHVIQMITEDILADAVKSLPLSEYHFTHTGDGWMCLLLGNDSARAMDFVNLSFTALRQRLDPYKQAFRAGMDYGFIHFRQTTISQNPSHFETPGIISARLESVAKPNQILSTETIHSIFSPHYEEMFPAEPLKIETKDRTLVAYNIVPLPLPNMRAIVSDLIYADPDRLGKTLCGTKKILIVDDENMLIELLTELLSQYVDKDRIVTAKDGEEALRLFKLGGFLVVLTDINMPRMNGIELANHIAAIDRDVPVLIMSGYSEMLQDNHIFDSGVVLAHSKPLSVESLLRGLFFAVTFGTPLNLRSRLHLITNDTSGFLRRIERIADEINFILKRANDSQDIGQSLLRHKAKQIAEEVIRRLIPGGDIVPYLESALKQLSKIRRLCSVINPYEDLLMEKHFQNMVTDYEKANKKTKFKLECNISDAPSLVSVRSVAFLIVAELIDNALDAIERKGTIPIDIYWERTLQQLRIEVADNGPGVKIEMLSNLFQSICTTKGEGRGLGLSLVYQACQSFHGEINYSRDEDTTVFTATFCLPNDPLSRVAKPEQTNSRAKINPNRWDKTQGL
jgi:CheY-like chemotaxis protein/anti-sigma regulatory factor (Ser/Thr protein kinase)